MSKNNDWKERLNIVYSTNPDFAYQTEEEAPAETLPAEKQPLRIELDKRHRNGIWFLQTFDSRLNVVTDNTQSLLAMLGQFLAPAFAPLGFGDWLITTALITGFTGSDDDLKELARLLKTKCGVGGSARDGEILIQGDLRQKVKEILIREGYTRTRII